MEPSNESRGNGPTLRILVLIAVLMVGLTWLIHWSNGLEHQRTPVEVCMNNLKQIGGLIVARMAAGSLKSDPGAAFILQTSEHVRNEDLKVFRCPSGDELVPTSYRGPDAFLLDMFRNGGTDKEGQSLIIACDANGPNGDEPHHKGGVCVLYSTTKVEFIRWEDMEGFDAGPVKVGPGSPDPRFRHLVQ